MNPLTPGSLQYIIASIIDFINRFLVPFVFALAFAIFLYGVFKYFFVNSVNDPKARVEGRKFILGAVVAFAVMLSVWGLVNIVRGTIPSLSSGQPPLPTFNAGTGSGGNNSGGGAPGGIPATPNRVPATSNNNGGTAPSSCANDDYACAAAQQSGSDVNGLY